MKGVGHLAKAQGVSLSTAARDLIKEALETYEDGQWHKIVQKRENTLNNKKTLSHKDVWSIGSRREA